MTDGGYTFQEAWDIQLSYHRQRMAGCKTFRALLVWQHRQRKNEKRTDRLLRGLGCLS